MDKPEQLFKKACQKYGDSTDLSSFNGSFRSKNYLRSCVVIALHHTQISGYNEAIDDLISLIEKGEEINIQTLNKFKKNNSRLPSGYYS